MLWRLKRADFERQKGGGNRKAMRKLVRAGEIPGILAFDGTKPIGWCAIAPRETYLALASSRVLKPIDDKPVWSVACLFIDKSYRKQGVSVELLRAACKYVKTQGGKIVEGYPVEPKKGEIPALFAWTGIANAFEKARFVEGARRSKTRPIMRRKL